MYMGNPYNDIDMYITYLVCADFKIVSSKLTLVLPGPKFDLQSHLAHSLPPSHGVGLIEYREKENHSGIIIYNHSTRAKNGRET